MVRRLVVLDIDGTLVGYDETVSARTVAAVQELRRLGVVVTLATGRRLRGTLDVADQLGISVPLILYNGSLVAESRPLTTLHVQTIAGDVARRMVDLIHDEGQAAFVYRHTAEPPDVFYQVALPMHAGYVGDSEYVACVADLRSACSAHEIIRVMTWGDAAPMDRAVARAKREFGLHETTMIVSDYRGYRNVEFYPPGASKASGIAVLAGRLGIGREEIVAIGDGCNDFEMIEYAGLGIAMGNACDELKRLADRVTGTVEEDGAATALEALIAEATAS